MRAAIPLPHEPEAGGRFRGMDGTTDVPTFGEAEIQPVPMPAPRSHYGHLKCQFQTVEAIMGSSLAYVSTEWVSHHAGPID